MLEATIFAGHMTLLTIVGIALILFMDLVFAEKLVKFILRIGVIVPVVLINCLLIVLCTWIIEGLYLINIKLEKTEIKLLS